MATRPGVATPGTRGAAALTRPSSTRFATVGVDPKRSYPRNSPQAAARLVALTLLADGHLAPSELEVLDRRNAHEQLGPSREDMHAVLHDFCEDLLHSAHLTWSDVCLVDPRTLSQLLADVDDPALRQKLLRLCLGVVQADDHIADGESVVLQAVVEHWGLQGEMFHDEPTRPEPAHA